MNTAQHVFFHKQFTKWVEATDVAEQCGLARKEMIDSVEFKTQELGGRMSNEVWRQNMIHEIDGHFVISSRDVWLPGAYETRRAANAAFRLDCAELQKLQDQANERAGGTGGLITEVDLSGLGG